MNEIKLIDLINIIIKEMNDPWIDSKRVGFIKDWMLKKLVISGESNKHIPGFNQEDFRDERKEENNNLLTGNEIIKGEYLVYWCCGHDAEEVIEEYSELKGVEDFLLEFHDNSFLNTILVFQDGRIKEWEVNGPPNTRKVIDQKVINGITCTTTKTIIHAKVEWIN